MRDDFGYATRGLPHIWPLQRSNPTKSAQKNGTFVRVSRQKSTKVKVFGRWRWGYLGGLRDHSEATTYGLPHLWPKSNHFQLLTLSVTWETHTKDQCALPLDLRIQRAIINNVKLTGRGQWWSIVDTDYCSIFQIKYVFQLLIRWKNAKPYWNPGKDRRA